MKQQNIHGDLTKKPTNSIKELIERVNLAHGVKPLDLRRDDYEKIYELQKSHYEGYDQNDWDNESDDNQTEELEKPISKISKNSVIEVRFILENELERFRPKFKKYILGDRLTQLHPEEELENPNFVITNRIQEETEKAARRFIKFDVLKGKLNFIADLVNKILLITEDVEGPSNTINQKNAVILKTLKKRRSIINEELISLPFSTRYEINEEGRIFINPDEFAQALNGIELVRIRSCENCKKIFWAERITAKCCSKKCSNLYHVKKSSLKRENDSNYVWEQDMKRRANIRAKKEIEKIGYKEADSLRYSRKNRKYPHRIIYDYLVNACFETLKSPEQIKIPNDLINPLINFISKPTIQNRKKTI